MMTVLDIILQIKHGRHMGMTTTDQHQMFSHFFPPQSLSLQWIYHIYKKKPTHKQSVDAARSIQYKSN
jgi:hypothetical protein